MGQDIWNKRGEAGEIKQKGSNRRKKTGKTKQESGNRRDETGEVRRRGTGDVELERRNRRIRNKRLGT